MRYPPEHKADIHQKIVNDASRRLRAEGLSGAAVSTVMQAAGLTHGGFYKHFANKNDLLIQSLREAFEQITNALTLDASRSKPHEAWKTVVKTYLSPEHCDHPEHGCPLAALASELVRTDKTIKPLIAAEMVKYKTRLLPFMPGLRTTDKEGAFFAIFSTMIGAVAIARMLPDPAMRKKVLANARTFLFRSFR